MKNEQELNVIIYRTHFIQLFLFIYYTYRKDFFGKYLF
jgi:hypothetical protein